MFSFKIDIVVYFLFFGLNDAEERLLMDTRVRHKEIFHIGKSAFNTWVDATTDGPQVSEWRWYSTAQFSDLSDMNSSHIVLQ